MANDNYIITAEKAAEIIQAATAGGYTTTLIINGEYYEIKKEATA